MRQQRTQIVPRLETDNLDDLLRDRVCVLVVRPYADPLVCKHVATFLRSSAEIEPYTHETHEKGKVDYVYLGVDRIGIPFNSTLDPDRAEEATRTYYDSALPGIRGIRNGCYPFLSPLDRLRVELDEIHPPGATVAAFHGRKMFVGIARLMRPEGSGASQEVPHFDALASSICELDVQLAANAFVAVSESGGELEVWDVRPLEPGDQLRPDWRNQADLPLAIKPEVGDMILFNARRPHAIRAFESGDRISLQCFIGHRASGPLLLWN
jgi:hypothetical protein